MHKKYESRNKRKTLRDRDVRNLREKLKLFGLREENRIGTGTETIGTAEAVDVSRICFTLTTAVWD